MSLQILGRFASFTLLMLASVAVEVFAAPSLEIYGRLPGFERAAISASGDHVALIGSVGDERRLLVFDKDKTLVVNSALGNAKIRGLAWAGDAFVLVDKSVTEKLEQGFTTTKAELSATIVVPIDGGQSWPVFAKSTVVTGGVRGTYGVVQRDGKWFGYFGGITYDPGYSGVLDGTVTSTAPVLYEVDLQTKRERQVARRADGLFRRWLIGPDGSIQATFDMAVTGSWQIRNSAGQKVADGSNPQGAVKLVGFGPVPGTIIYSSRSETDTEDHLFQVPLVGGETQEILQGVLLRGTIVDNRQRTLAGYEIDGDFPSYRLFNAHQQKVIVAAQKAFPGLAMHLIDWNDAFDRLIVMTEGTGDPQTWWLVDIRTGKATQLGVSYPMPASEVGPMKMVRYKASDGTDINAVLTLPPRRPAQRLPIVVLPHSGPTVRDYPNFDWLAQAFASRGYAVLQPNFRGSSGYGVPFERASDGEWGRKMQTDISDGLEYLVREGIAAPQRVCIMGMGYGGYAALAGVTVQQGIYRCAIAVAGFSNVAKFASDRVIDTDFNSMFRRALRAEMGSGRDLAAVSPIRLISRVTVPVLLIHGKDDVVVPYEQSSDMANALRAAGKPVEFVTLAHEDHWLSQNETRLAMLKAAVAFVEKNNPPDPAK